MVNNLSAPHEAEFLFYSGPDGKQHIEVFYAGETVWLTQKRMAELFGVEVNTINYHLKEVFGSGELVEDSVIRKFRTTAADGKRYLTAFYNLDAIISVGYRVNSLQATAFRKWATATLREYMVKGFVLDDERLAQGTHFGKDYYEMIARVDSISFSRFYGTIYYIGKPTPGIVTQMRHEHSCCPELLIVIVSQLNFFKNAIFHFTAPFIHSTEALYLFMSILFAGTVKKYFIEFSLPPICSNDCTPRSSSSK